MLKWALRPSRRSPRSVLRPLWRQRAPSSQNALGSAGPSEAQPRGEGTPASQRGAKSLLGRLSRIPRALGTKMGRTFQAEIAAAAASPSTPRRQAGTGIEQPTASARLARAAQPAWQVLPSQGAEPEMGRALGSLSSVCLGTGGGGACCEQGQPLAGTLKPPGDPEVSPGLSVKGRSTQ